MSTLSELFNDPTPLRTVLRIALRAANVGSYSFRYGIGAVHRPNYAYLVYQAALLARRLGEPRVSVVELGVAGGAGLLALESHAEEVERLLGVKVEIYGFDTGEGLPEPEGYRDLPYHWKAGFYRMDVGSLRSKLRRSTLIIGDIRETIDGFIDRYQPAPLGAVSYDLDFYSSTMAGLKLLEIASTNILPRVFLYFDDTMGGDLELYNDHTGARLAICEFNSSHEARKMSPLYYLRALAPQRWHHRMWSLHNFDHPAYGQFISVENQQLPIYRTARQQLEGPAA